MQHNIIYIMVITAMLFFIGCTRLPDRPEGMPDVTPCVIEVTFGGKRLSDVSVLLKPVTGGIPTKTPGNTGGIPTKTPSITDGSNVPSGWAAGGKTGADGKAVMMTATHYRGVVPGEYIISFEKYAPEELRSDGMPLPAKPLVPIKYSQRQSKEIVTVTKTQSVYRFELDGF